MLLVNRLFTNVETNTSFNQVEVRKKCSVCTNNRQTENCRRISSECKVCQSLRKLCKRMYKTNDQNMCALSRLHRLCYKEMRS